MALCSSGRPGFALGSIRQKVTSLIWKEKPYASLPTLPGHDAAWEYACSNESGKVSINWSVDRERLILLLRETGGPAVTSPEGLRHRAD